MYNHEQAIELTNDWNTNPRWQGITRPYPASEVVRLRGSIQLHYTLAQMGATRLWQLLSTEPFVRALGAMTGNQAVESVAAGLKAIYASGWQVAGDANDALQMYPDQSLYPVSSVPNLVKRINNALVRADQIQHMQGKNDVKLINVLLINDAEAKMLAGEHNLPRAANKVLAMGPQALFIKHGEYGATIFFREGAFGLGSHPFRAPALPIEEVKDPTGAGDSFAGGFMGYIASQEELNREVLKRALFYGGVMGSFAVERFGTERLQNLTREEIDARFQVFRELTHLE